MAHRRTNCLCGIHRCGVEPVAQAVDDPVDDERSIGAEGYAKNDVAFDAKPPRLLGVNRARFRDDLDRRPCGFRLRLCLSLGRRGQVAANSLARRRKQAFESRSPPIPLHQVQDFGQVGLGADFAVPDS